MGKSIRCKEFFIIVSYIFTIYSTVILFLEKTIQWGILHFTLTHTFKNYVNITVMDEKFNLCDYFVDLFKVNCPIPPGIYHDDTVLSVVPDILWPVSKRYSVSLLLFYFIG